MSVKRNVIQQVFKVGEIENNSDDEDDDDDDDEEDRLQIVLESPNLSKRRTKLVLNEKEKEVIACIEKDLEETLEQKAEKAKLNANHVKNILKHVVTNEHVVAFLRQVENGPTTDQPITVFEPKFTRAKTKQLLSNTDKTVWQVPQPVKVSETQLLIAEDLQEDSSGDEYIPQRLKTNNKSTDDSLNTTVLSNEGDNCNANIALRTRSKYNLSHQKLEEIEGAFMPPDITTDMYDMDCDDDVWRDFLKTFTKPLDEVAKLPEDEEQDPEYNILADEDELDEVDTEELRVDRGVTIPKKEVNNLMAELFEFVDFYEARKHNKTCTKDNSNNNISNNDSNNNNNSGESAKEGQNVIVEEIREVQYNQSPTEKTYQLEILAQQMRQHVQLATQHFLLTYEHPEFGYMASKFKRFVEEFKEYANGSTSSYFYTANLDEALKLIENWESFYKSDSSDVRQTKVHVKTKLEESKRGWKKPTFPPKILETIANSTVFIYPDLLPQIPFKSQIELRLHYFSDSESHLIALFLEQWIPTLKQDPYHINKKKTVTIRHVCHYIKNLLMPQVAWDKIERHIRTMRHSHINNNPIRYYFQNNTAPPFTHTILPFDPDLMLPPAKLDPDVLPYVWRKYIHDKKLRIAPEQVVLITAILPNGEENSRKLLVQLPEKTVGRKTPILKRLHNRQINKLGDMLPDMPSLGNTPIKQNLINNEIDENDENRGKEQENVQQQQSQTKSTVTNEIRTNFQDIELSSNQIIFSNLNPSEKDNPDDINELMIASSTVKNVRKEPSGAEKKRAKIRREFLANLAMATPETPENKAENEANFAIAYHEKLKEQLTEEEYYHILQVCCDFDQYSPAVKFTEFFNRIQAILMPKYEELAEEFLLFLTTYQANKVGKLMTHLLMKDMSDFMKKVSIYYKDQPLQMKKFLKCLTDLCHTPDLTIETVKNTMLPLFKGNEVLIELFLQMFPNEKPSKLLINGPCEVVDLKKEMSRQPDDEICETIVVPDTEDPYGGANCICDCHNVDNQQFKLRSNHCNRCGLKFIQGKPYIQTGKGLRPAIVSFLTNPEKDHSKRLMAVQRKRSDSNPIKQNSPNKDQNPEEVESEDEVDGTKKKRKRKVKRNVKSVKNPVKNKDTIKSCDTLKESKTKTVIVKKPQRKRCVKKSPQHKLGSNPGQLKRLPTESNELHVPSGESDSEFIESSQDLTNTDSDNGSESSEVNNQKDSWSREEDKIILQTFKQRKGNEETFQHIAQLLRNRSVVEIKTRFKKLMSLLHEMAPKSV